MVFHVFKERVTVLGLVTTFLSRVRHAQLDCLGELHIIITFNHCWTLTIGFPLAHLNRSGQFKFLYVPPARSLNSLIVRLLLLGPVPQLSPHLEPVRSAPKLLPLRSSLAPVQGCRALPSLCLGIPLGCVIVHRFPLHIALRGVLRPKEVVILRAAFTLPHLDFDIQLLCLIPVLFLVLGLCFIRLFLRLHTHRTLFGFQKVGGLPLSGIVPEEDAPSALEGIHWGRRQNVLPILFRHNALPLALAAVSRVHSVLDSIHLLPEGAALEVSLELEGGEVARGRRGGLVELCPVLVRPLLPHFVHHLHLNGGRERRQNSRIHRVQVVRKEEVPVVVVVVIVRHLDDVPLEARLWRPELLGLGRLGPLLRLRVDRRVGDFRWVLGGSLRRGRGLIRRGGRGGPGVLAHGSLERVLLQLGHQQLLCGLLKPDALLLPPSPSRRSCSALERRSGPVEHEDRANLVEEKLADPSEEAQDVSVPHHFPSLVPHGLHELDDPDRRIDSHLLVCERLHVHPLPDGLEESP